jgi:long-chain fatty acid transport protein
MRGKGLFFSIVLGVAAVLLGVQLCFAAGFSIYEGSARGNALGGTLVGRADDPSALYYNPAGITQLPGVQVMGGATFILPSTTVNSFSGGRRTSTDTEDNVWVPPHAYITAQATDNIWFGLGVFSQFGLGTEFDENWPGRYSSYEAIIQSLTVNPNVAIKFNDQFSLAAGFDIMWFDVDLSRKINISQLVNIPGLPDIDRNLTGDSFGYGVNLGLRYQPMDWLAFGASYRSQVKQSLNGNADFTKSGIVATNPLFSRAFNDTNASANITLPDSLFLGVMFKPVDRWSVEVGATWTNWSTFDALTVKYDVDPQALTTGSATYSNTKDWEAVWRYQIGVEYKPLDWLDLRAGYVFDESPIQDEWVDYLVPANDRHLFNVGTGFHWNKWTLDLSYTYLMIEDRDVDESRSEGVLLSDFEDGHAHLIGMSVGYKF